MEMNSYQREAARTINKGLSRSEVEAHARKELGDLLWFIRDRSLRKVAQENIDKLRARYPDGFNTDQSLHRRDGDI